MRKHKFLLLIFILVVLLFVASGYVLYASLVSEPSKEMKLPFFHKEEVVTTTSESVDTTPAVTTSPDDRMCFISFYSGTQWLYTDVVKYGEMPKYVGKTPEKDPDDQYIYAFEGWSEVITPAKENRSYTAIFSKIERTVTITFKDSMNNVLETKTVPYNSTVSGDMLPESYKDERFEYTPIGWTLTNGLSECVDLSKVTTDMVLYPAFDVTRHSSLVTFVNTDGTILQQGFVKLGQKPKYNGKTPTQASDGKYDYTFKSWNRSISVVGDTDEVYTAIYDSKYCTFKVTFCDTKADKRTEITVTYGSTAKYPGKIPDIKYGAYVYEFAFWAISDTLAEPVDLSYVTSDLTVFAYYTQKIGR